MFNTGQDLFNLYFGTVFIVVAVVGKFVLKIKCIVQKSVLMFLFHDSNINFVPGSKDTSFL